MMGVNVPGIVLNLVDWDVSGWFCLYVIGQIQIQIIYNIIYEEV